MNNSKMRLLLLNYPYLAEELKARGIEIFSAGLTDDCDLKLDIAEYHLDNILNRIDFAPDSIIFMDSVDRIIPKGLEDSPFPLAACFIDSTINRFWQYPLARLFDIVLFDQKHDAESNRRNGLDSHWFPLAADTDIYKSQSVEKVYDISFIGSRNAETRIKRNNILNKLSREFSLQIFDGNPPVSANEAADIYNRSKLVLNENLFPSLNLRLFEVMASGTAVLTEENGDGLPDLFRDGKHIITYNPDNLVDKIRYYLEFERERKGIATRGRELVETNHSFAARAQELIELLGSAKKRVRLSLMKRKVALAEALVGYYLKWPEKDPSALKLSDEFLRVAEISSQSAMQLRGKLKLIQGDLTSAEISFHQTTEQFNTNYQAYLNYGLILWQIGKRDIAQSYLVKAGELVSQLQNEETPASIPAEPGSEEFHVFWGSALRDLGLPFIPGLMMFGKPMQFWTALEHFAAAATLNPLHYEALGDLLLEIHSPDQALQAYERVESITDEKLKQTARLAYQY